MKILKIIFHELFTTAPVVFIILSLIEIFLGNPKNIIAYSIGLVFVVLGYELTKNK